MENHDHHFDNHRVYGVGSILYLLGTGIGV